MLDPISLKVCFATGESGGNSPDDWTTLADNYTQVASFRFEPERTVAGSSQPIRFIGAWPEDVVAWTLADDCTDEGLSGPATPNKTVEYEIIDENTTVALHADAEPGSWKFCIKPRGNSVWNLIGSFPMTVLPKPTFGPTTGAAGSPVELTFVGSQDGDFIVIEPNVGFCNNSQLAVTGGSSLARTELNNSAILTSDAMEVPGAVQICYATAESGGDEQGDYTRLSLTLLQQAGGSFANPRVTVGSSPWMNVTRVTTGDKVSWVRSTDYGICSATFTGATSNPGANQAGIYQIIANTFIDSDGFTNQMLQLHNTAAAGTWTFCHYIGLSQNWVSLGEPRLTIIEHPSFSPQVSVAGTPTLLTFTGSHLEFGDIVVLKAGGCTGASVASFTATSSSPHTFNSSYVLTTTKEMVGVSNLTVCYATNQAAQIDSSDGPFAPLAINLEQILPFSMTTNVATSPNRTVVGVPQVLTIRGGQATRADQVFFTLSNDCIRTTDCSPTSAPTSAGSGIDSGSAPSTSTCVLPEDEASTTLSVVHDITGPEQTVALHTTAAAGEWHLCARPAFDGLWGMMNTPDAHEPIIFTVALDTAPTVTGTPLYYVGDNAVISLEDLVITDPDVIYETKDLLQIRISCTAGRFTVTSPGAVAFTGDTLGVSEQDVTMTGTRSAVQSALISVVYTADSTSWDTISIVATALASVITPNLAGSLAVSIQYSCSQASAPRISSATFHSTQAAIEIWFDRATTMSTGTFDCSTLFDTATVFYFGIGAACSFSTADNLKVALGTDPAQPTTLQPGSNLVFKDRLLRSCASSNDYFSGTVVVGSPLTTAFPNVTIDAPSQVSSCDALTIDGSSSQGYGGLPISYSWTMNSSFVNDTSVTLASTTASSVTFTSTDLVKFDGSVQLFLTIRDYLSQRSVAKAVQVPVKATASPQPSITVPSLAAIVTSSVSIDGESVRVPEYSVYASTKTTLNGAMFVPECAKTPGVAWIISWTCVSHSSINSALQGANTMR